MALTTEKAAASLFNWYKQQHMYFKNSEIPKHPTWEQLKEASEAVALLVENPSQNISKIPLRTLPLIGGQMACWLALATQYPCEELCPVDVLEEDVLRYVLATQIQPMSCYAQGSA